ncbi:MAG TPA: hypothetical protein VMB50_06040 [Myxococcales bacterium]|nr:hypothetical protein [Myxococcales bacterium]
MRQTFLFFVPVAFALAACSGSSGGGTTGANSSAGGSSGAGASSSSGASSGAGASSGGGASTGAAASSSSSGSGSTTGAAASTSSGSGSTGAGTGGSGASSGGSSCGNNGSACSSLAQQGSAITINQVAQALPAPAGGGAPPDGTYVATSATVYTGAGGATGSLGQEELTIGISSGGTQLQVAQAQVQNGQACAGSIAGSMTFPSGATTFDLTQTCGNGSSSSQVAPGYTYDSSASPPLTIYIPMGNGGTQQTIVVTGFVPGS